MVVKQFQDSGRPPFWKSIYHYISVIWCFCTEQGHCGACKGKWWLTDTDLCHCGESQMISHIVESCPLTKLNGGLSRLHSADEDAVLWLTSYGSWVMTRICEEEEVKNHSIFMKFCTQQHILNSTNVTWSKMKKLHWTDSEFDRTYFLSLNKSHEKISNPPHQMIIHWLSDLC